MYAETNKLTSGHKKANKMVTYPPPHDFNVLQRQACDIPVPQPRLQPGRLKTIWAKIYRLKNSCFTLLIQKTHKQCTWWKAGINLSCNTSSCCCFLFLFFNWQIDFFFAYLPHIRLFHAHLFITDGEIISLKKWQSNMKVWIILCIRTPN